MTTGRGNGDKETTPLPLFLRIIAAIFKIAEFLSQSKSKKFCLENMMAIWSQGSVYTKHQQS